MSKPSLGAGDVKIVLDGEEVTLRPTLRACQVISRESGGIVGAINRAAQFDVDVIASCVALGLDKTPKDVAEAVYSTGLVDLAPKVMEWLSMLANGGRPRTGGSESTGGPSDDVEVITFSEWVDDQFQIATGWLGWSPAVALAADLNEIALARAGKVQMLRACFGGAEPEPVGPAMTPDLFDAMFE